MGERLDAAEMARWIAWKRAGDTVWGEVVRAVAEATGLSAPDFSVLTRVVEADTPARQQALADDLGWSRSRLSHQLSRMTERGLVRRLGTTTATTIEATARGRRLGARARVAHAAAVRRALLDLAPDEASDFWRVIEDLGATTEDRAETPET